MNIDTTSQQYQKFVNGLDDLRALMAPRFVLFEKLSPEKQRQWLQRDLLFRKVLKMSLKVSEWAQQFRDETEND
jgi:hypothetical protein